MPTFLLNSAASRETSFCLTSSGTTAFCREVWQGRDEGAGAGQKAASCAHPCGATARGLWAPPARWTCRGVAAPRRPPCRRAWAAAAWAGPPGGPERSRQCASRSPCPPRAPAEIGGWGWAGVGELATVQSPVARCGSRPPGPANSAQEQPAAGSPIFTSGSPPALTVPITGPCSTFSRPTRPPTCTRMRLRWVGSSQAYGIACPGGRLST